MTSTVLVAPELLNQELPPHRQVESTPSNSMLVALDMQRNLSHFWNPRPSFISTLLRHLGILKNHSFLLCFLYLSVVICSSCLWLRLCSTDWSANYPCKLFFPLMLKFLFTQKKMLPSCAALIIVGGICSTTNIM